MINEIELSNFRPHLNLKLKNLHPNLNVFIGDTGTGKTSIFRALRLLFSNEPPGGAKLYKFKENAKLIVKALVDDIVITRESKKYTIKKINVEKPLELTSFGRGAPQPIKNILNLQDINWQLQIQPHFLILENGGNASKYLNPILGSEDSELILTEIKKQSSKFKEDFRLQNSIIKDNEIILSKYKNIGEFHKRIKKIQKLYNHNKATERLIFSLEKMFSNFQKIDSQMIGILKLKMFKKKVENIESKSVDIYHLELDVNRLEKYLKKFKKLKYISVKSYMKTLEQIEEKNLEKNSLQTDIDKLQSLLKSYKTLNETLEEGLKEYDKIKNKWDISFSKLKICPFCSQPIKKINYT